MTKGAQILTLRTYSEDYGETRGFGGEIGGWEERKIGNSIIWIYRKENIDHSTCNIEL